MKLSPHFEEVFRILETHTLNAIFCSSYLYGKNFNALRRHPDFDVETQAYLLYGGLLGYLKGTPLWVRDDEPLIRIVSSIEIPTSWVDLKITSSIGFKNGTWERDPQLSSIDALVSKALKCTLKEAASLREEIIFWGGLRYKDREWETTPNWDEAFQKLRIDKRTEEYPSFTGSNLEKISLLTRELLGEEILSLMKAKTRLQNRKVLHLFDSEEWSEDDFTKADLVIQETEMSIKILKNRHGNIT